MIPKRSLVRDHLSEESFKSASLEKMIIDVQNNIIATSSVSCNKVTMTV